LLYIRYVVVKKMMSAWP